MESKNKLKENEWLRLLKGAIDEGIKIQVNHRFKYKGKSLGTFLTSAKIKNNAELNKKIKRLGVNFKMHSTNPEHYLAKFTKQLSSTRKPVKQAFMTRFNMYVLPKKELLKEETINKLNKVWEKKFGDLRKWETPITTVGRIALWKEFRYDEKRNPEKKWFQSQLSMGKAYGWAFTRLRDAEKMNLILEYFNEDELSELRQEGF